MSEELYYIDKTFQMYHLFWDLLILEISTKFISQVRSSIRRGQILPGVQCRRISATSAAMLNLVLMLFLYLGNISLWTPVFRYNNIVII